MGDAGPVQLGLFSSLVAHEVARPVGLDRRDSLSGLRPRLPNLFESCEATLEVPSLGQGDEHFGSPRSEVGGGRQPEVGSPPDSSIGASDDKTNASAPPLVVQPARKSDSFGFGFGLSRSDKPDIAADPGELLPRGPLTAPTTSQASSAVSRSSNGYDAASPSMLTPSITVDRLFRGDAARIHGESVPEVQESLPLAASRGVFAETARQSAPRPIQPKTRQEIIQQDEKAIDSQIEIHIGRIDVRAQVQPTPPPQEASQSQGSAGDALQAYLRVRTRGARS